MSAIILVEKPKFKCIPDLFYSYFVEIMEDNYEYYARNVKDLPSFEDFWQDDQLEELLSEITSFIEFGDKNKYLSITDRELQSDFLNSRDYEYFRKDIYLFLNYFKLSHFDEELRLRNNPLCEVW